MALSIKDEEADRLARELAAATGESITVAARIALQERLRRVTSRQESTGDAAVIQDIIDRARRRTVADERSDDEILGYDADGIPTQ